MKIQAIVYLLFFITASVAAQVAEQPVQVNLKSGESIDAEHFGQVRCGKDIHATNYIFIRGKYMDNVTEIKDFKDIEKIVLEGYTAAPVTTIGNEKGVLRVFKKNGVSVSLEEAELIMSCYGSDDLYNAITVKIVNPLTDKPAEKTIEVRNIQSIIFK